MPWINTGGEGAKTHLALRMLVKRLWTYANIITIIITSQLSSLKGGRKHLVFDVVHNWCSQSQHPSGSQKTWSQNFPSQMWFHYFLPVCPWASYLSSNSLPLLITQVARMRVPTEWSWGGSEMNYIKPLAVALTQSMHSTNYVANASYCALLLEYHSHAWHLWLSFWDTWAWSSMFLHWKKKALGFSFNFACILPLQQWL